MWTVCECRSRTREQEEIVAKLKNQLAESETKMQQQAREFETFKKELHTKPEVQLQTEVNFMKLDKVRCL